MKLKIITLIAGGILLLSGCGDDSSTSVIKAEPIKIQSVISDVKKVKTKVTNDMQVTNQTPELLYKSCKGCHGVTGEKRALGKSAIIKGWSEDKIYKALSGYKDGTYGSTMKRLMKGKVKNLSSDDIKQLSLYISNF